VNVGGFGSCPMADSIFRGVELRVPSCIRVCSG